jgi:regulator of sigma D
MSYIKASHSQKDEITKKCLDYLRDEELIDSKTMTVTQALFDLRENVDFNIFLEDKLEIMNNPVEKWIIPAWAFRYVDNLEQLLRCHRDDAGNLFIMGDKNAKERILGQLIHLNAELSKLISTVDVEENHKVWDIITNRLRSIIEEIDSTEVTSTTTSSSTCMSSLLGEQTHVNFKFYKAILFLKCSTNKTVMRQTL